MDFRDIGFEKFLKHYGDKHLLENLLRKVYHAGYEDGWRDKHDKNVRERPHNVIFVFEKAHECVLYIKEEMIDEIYLLKDHEVVLKNGTTFYIYTPDQVKSGALCNISINSAYIDSEYKDKKRIEQLILKYLEPKNSESCFVPFSAIHMMNFKEL